MRSALRMGASWSYGHPRKCTADLDPLGCLDRPHREPPRRELNPSLRDRLGCVSSPGRENRQAVQPRDRVGTPRGRSADVRPSRSALRRSLRTGPSWNRGGKPDRVGRRTHASHPGEDLENLYDINARMIEGGLAYIAILRDFSARIFGVKESTAEMGYGLLRSFGGSMPNDREGGSSTCAPTSADTSPPMDRVPSPPGRRSVVRSRDPAADGAPQIVD
jgi:hypothetical protein